MAVTPLTGSDPLTTMPTLRQVSFVIMFWKALTSWPRPQKTHIVTQYTQTGQLMEHCRVMEAARKLEVNITF